MIMKLIFATGNKNKLREIKEIMAGLDYEIITAAEAGIFLIQKRMGRVLKKTHL